ncbi:hypothetical protein EJ08DRAFT_301246 [Tothia fuscella]|uniref:Uncharacterized protein n=1 Tax=Tothia fuscella TaxID=1048955 RepID=A0A9P4NP82_9PEZI|nr:hypothetical protein EJ08DRAFT_301246 [Tothia fuscella]
MNLQQSIPGHQQQTLSVVMLLPPLLAIHLVIQPKQGPSQLLVCVGIGRRIRQVCALYSRSSNGSSVGRNTYVLL